MAETQKKRPAIDIANQTNLKDRKLTHPDEIRKVHGINFNPTKENDMRNGIGSWGNT